MIGHTRAAVFVLPIAGLLTLAMVLFPPFTGVGGMEHAFVLNGPEWSRGMGAVGRELGLTARIHWAVLLLQLLGLWTAALGARSFLEYAPARGARARTDAPSEDGSQSG